MIKIKNLIFSLIITLFFTKLKYAAGNTFSLGGKVKGLTIFGYILLTGAFLSITGLGILFWLKKRGELD